VRRLAGLHFDCVVVQDRPPKTGFAGNLYPSELVQKQGYPRKVLLLQHLFMRRVTARFDIVGYDAYQIHSKSHAAWSQGRFFSSKGAWNRTPNYTTAATCPSLENGADLGCTLVGSRRDESVRVIGFSTRR
jgi:hypothetical protein